MGCWFWFCFVWVFLILFILLEDLGKSLGREMLRPSDYSLFWEGLGVLGWFYVFFFWGGGGAGGSGGGGGLLQLF